MESFYARRQDLDEAEEMGLGSGWESGRDSFRLVVFLDLLVVIVDEVIG